MENAEGREPPDAPRWDWIDGPANRRIEYLAKLPYFARRLHLAKYNVPRETRFLYKLMRASPLSYIRDIIIKSRLYLSAPAAFNDPFDMRATARFAPSTRKKKERLSQLLKQQMQGACGLFSFILKRTSIEEIENFCEGLQHILMAVSWGGHESLIIPGCASLNENEFDANNPDHRMIRMYAGLEDAAYLINDLERGFGNMKSIGP